MTIVTGQEAQLDDISQGLNPVKSVNKYRNWLTRSGRFLLVLKDAL